MSSASDFAMASQSLAAVVLQAAIDPADALRMLSELAQFVPQSIASTSPIGNAIASMQDSVGDLFRRTAVIAMARASSFYQPSSYDDAAAIRSMVCAFIDAETQVAGDQGEDATFNALRALRAAVSEDLTQRGANLATIVSVSTPLPLPAPVLALRLYRDATRADELIAEADSPHPAFLATSFRVLSS